MLKELLLWVTLLSGVIKTLEGIVRLLRMLSADENQ